MHFASTLLAVLSLAASATSVTAAAVRRQDAAPIGVVLAGAPVNDINITASPLPLEQCGAVNISWSNGEPPYRLKIGTGGYYLDSTWLYEYDNLTTPTWFEWVVNATTNTSLNFQIYDATNQTKNVQNLVVGPGNATCFNVTTLPADDQPPTTANVSSVVSVEAQ
ncbi:hypothetical protein Q5752_001538 [Cryptotrichosporon argae]